MTKYIPYKDSGYSSKEQEFLHEGTIKPILGTAVSIEFMDRHDVDDVSSDYNLAFMTILLLSTCGMERCGEWMDTQHPHLGCSPLKAIQRGGKSRVLEVYRLCHTEAVEGMYRVCGDDAIEAAMAEVVDDTVHVTDGDEYDTIEQLMKDILGDEYEEDPIDNNK